MSWVYNGPDWLGVLIWLDGFGAIGVPEGHFFSSRSSSFSFFFFVFFFFNRILLVESYCSTMLREFSIDQ